MTIAKKKKELIWNINDWIISDLIERRIAIELL